MKLDKETVKSFLEGDLENSELRDLYSSVYRTGAREKGPAWAETILMAIGEPWFEHSGSGQLTGVRTGDVDYPVRELLFLEEHGSTRIELEMQKGKRLPTGVLARYL